MSDRWQLIEAIFHKAAELAPETRPAFLSEACAGDESLRKEVESLLAHESEDGSTFVGAAAIPQSIAHYRISGKLGPYEVLSPIGAGGMGEVYLAHDPRMGRDIAIKVTAERFSDRFSREVHAVAALNHPHICHLYDVGPDYLVMELCEGETLADRLKRGKLSMQEAVRYGAQIADALVAAHAKGIVHRDLKPGNVMLTKAGVKVLDFGLAKIDHRVPDEVLTETLTGKGTILGTVQYMSPEQAQGKETDARSDIFSFGLVFYEMITGTRAFTGANPTSIMAAILEWEAPTLEPEGLNRVVRACLAKDPTERFQSALDLKRAIEWSGSGDGEQGAPVPGGARRPWLAWSVAAALAVIAVVALWAPWRAEKPVDRPLVRLDLDLGADVSLPSAISGSNVAISPDGTRLAYASGTPTKLFTRRLDQPQATELPGTQGATQPFFSPDGQWVGFVGVGRINKISVEGGAVVPLTNIANVTFGGASWGEDGSILVSEFKTKGLLRLPPGGAPPETVAELGRGEFALALPQFLPGGKAILFSAHTVPDMAKSTIEVLTLADRHRKIVARGGQSARYLPTSGGSGHLVYVNKATLFAIPFDLDKLETRGTAVPVLDDVANATGFASGQLGISRTGVLVYRKAGGGSPEMTMLQWVDPSGRKDPLRAKSAVYRYVSLSPDGKRVALVIAEGGSEDLWVYDPQRDALTRLTFGGAFYSYPRWSPDGQHVVFGSHGNGIFQARADGASQPQALVQGKSAQFPWSFTPDGKQLAYDDLGDGHWRIWTVPLEDQGGQLKAGKPEQIKSSFTELNPSISLDGRWMAYESSESGRSELFVRAFPAPSSGQGGRWQISNGGGQWAHWPRNGHDLVYQSGDQMMAASYTVKGDAFVAGKPRVWIPKLGGRVWGLAPDGKRVVVVTPIESADAPKPEHEVVFLENFFDELRRKVPVGK